MKLAAVDPIVKAVLYEGYILYPYRPSALKNQQRWTFGGIYPQDFCQMMGASEPASMQTECLVEGGLDTSLEVKVRFLHLQQRLVGTLGNSPAEGEPVFHALESLRIGERLFTSWQEAVERDVDCPTFTMGALLEKPVRLTFSFPGRRATEVLPGLPGDPAGAIVRWQQAVQGLVEVSADVIPTTSWQAGQTARELYKIRVQIFNTTPLDNPGQLDRDGTMLHAFISTHTLLGVQNGEFVSLLDPPEPYQAAVAGCQNMGTWPVLVGAAGERDLILSSPITLYDYPEIAPESQGDLFDGTEIDEILTLRILTLTEEEKQQIREADERGRELLERTESLQPDQLWQLHGAMRYLHPTRRSTNESLGT